ncbi:MAG: putative amino-acid racemase [Chlamydiae bacterium]|nr:putative amino-acid racemase [Chlamydiota bacterium]
MEIATIGILAGMGPKSTAPFIDQVVIQSQSILNAKEQIEFPPMMIYSLPTSFYMDKPMDHEVVKNEICQGLKRLEKSEVSFIVMPCNTAHIYYEFLQKCVKVPLINMIDMAVDSLPSNIKKVAILATSYTIDSQLYQKRLKEKGIEYLVDEELQVLVNQLISKITSEKDYGFIKNLWEKISNILIKKNIDTIIFACSDLNIILDKVQIQFNIVDPTLCLAKEAVKKWKKVNG